MKDIKHILLKIKKKKITKSLSLHPPILDADDEKSIAQVIKSNWVSTKGKKTVQFEKELKNYFKVKFSVALNSGTSSLFLALKTLNVKSNEEVLVPNISFIAAPNAIIYTGAKPHLVDTIKDGLNLCPIKLQEYLLNNTIIKNNSCFNKKTGLKISCMVVIHVFGHMCEMEKFKKISKKFKIPIIEDAAEAVGSLYNGKNPGYYSDIAIISFNGNKIITTGGGGAILTNKKKYYTKALSLATLNNKKNVNNQNFSEVGYNVRMPSLNAALGISQMRKINFQVKKKRNIYNNYKKLISNNKYLYLFSETGKQKSNYWLQCLVIKKKYSKKTIQIFNQMKDEGISARMLWSPLNKVSYLKRCQKSNLINSNEIYKRVICIPSN